MLLHQLKISGRLFLRNRFFTVINLAGLSIGFGAFLILWPYAHTELNSDQWHVNSDRIVRLSTHLEWTDDNVNWNGWYSGDNMSGAGKLIKDNFREVEALTRFIPQANFKPPVQGAGSSALCTIYNSDRRKNTFIERGLAYVDPNFFEFFSFPLVIGDPHAVLQSKNSAVISERTAAKYFGSNDPINRVIYLSDSIPITVTGVFKDVPANSHLAFDIAITTAGVLSLDQLPSFDWMGFNYVRLRTNDITGFARELERRHEEIFKSNETGNVRVWVYVQPLQDIIFERLRSGNAVVKSKTPLLLLRLIAFAILFLAWGNYVSLSFNRVNQRLTELGTRKAIGATPMNLLFQFLTEAALINVVAFLIAITLVQLVERVAYVFGFYVVKVTDLPMTSLIMILAVLVFGIMLSAAYPVWIAWKHQSLALLKKLGASEKPAWLNGVATFQYSAALVMMIWIVIVHLQLDFILNRNIGVEPENIVVVNCPIAQDHNFDSRLSSLLQSLQSVRGVLGAALSHDLPGAGSGNLYVKRNQMANEMALDINGGVDENFIPLLGIKMLAGRNFYPDKPSDRNAVLISDGAVKRLGLVSPDEAIGTKLILPHAPGEEVEVIGVYRDYEFRPFLAGQREEGRGSILTYKAYRVSDFNPQKILLRVDTRDIDPVLRSASTLFTSTFEEPFEWSFLDETIQKHYEAEKIARTQMGLFTILAIVIACLGLFGMITNRITEKTKEIGIRRVLGAGMRQIAGLLIRATAFQVTFALIVGMPVAYYLVTEYLAKYSERITLKWWHFALPVAAMLLIMSLTILWVMTKSSSRKAVDSLRYE